MEFIAIQTFSQLQDFRDYGGIPCLDRDRFELDRPDAHFLVIEDKSIVAYYSLWWRQTPNYLGDPTGTIGHLGGAIGGTILNRACADLAMEGCCWAIAPMDGNTWHHYRLMVEPRGQPFWLEPQMGNVDVWLEAGFKPIAQYSSILCQDLDCIDPRLLRLRERLGKLGIYLESLTPEALGGSHFEGEMKEFYRVAIKAFRQNFLYTTIPEADFIALYRPILPYLRPELILRAQWGEQVVGFLFAFPDFLEKERLGKVATVIIKTVAVLPGRCYGGLGNVLVAESHAIAARLGYTRVIHALIHNQNSSLNLSRHYGEIRGRYMLLGRELTTFFV